MSPADIIALSAAIATAILSLIAIGISLRANRISKAAHSLATKSYFSERRIFLKSDRRADRLVLSAAGSDQTINNVTLYFPQPVGISPIALVASNLDLLDDRIASQIRSYWDSRTSLQPGHQVIRENAPIPIIGLVHGQTKGDSTVTLGIYDLYSQYIRSDKGSTLSIKTLALNNYAGDIGDPQKTVDRILSEIEAIFPPV